MSRRLFLVTALLLPLPPVLAADPPATAASPAAAGAPVDASADALAARIDAAIGRYYKPDGPGATVIVTQHGKPVFRRAYGLADVAARRPLTPDTVLRLASITKQFTAVAVLLLADEGKLALTDPVSKYLPDYPMQGKTITIEHLLTHTAGIPNYTALPDARAVRQRNLTVPQMIDRFKNLPLEFEPGTRFAYSNSGYFLLGAIIEKAAGMPFAAFLERRIFTPLGMRDTGYEGYGAQQASTAPRAAGYTGRSGTYAPAEAISMTQPYAAGGLVSTVDDLARWDAAITAGKLLKPATWRRAFTPYTLADGKSAGYGYGWGINDLLGQQAISHSGGIDGFSTHAMRLPQAQVYVAVLQNASSGLVSPDVPARKAAAIMLGKPFPERSPIALAPAALQAFAGQYGTGGKSTHTVRRVGDSLLLQRGGPVRRLVPYAPTAFMVEDTLATAEFNVGADGKATSVRIDNADRPVTLERTGDVPVRQAVAMSHAVFDAYRGRYELAPGVVLEITREGDRFYGQATGQPKVEMTPMGERSFFSDEVDAEVEFLSGAGGAVDRLVLRQHGRETPARRVEAK